MQINTLQSRRYRFEMQIVGLTWFIFKAVDNMGQLVYDYGPHNVNPDIFSEEKEKNEKLYFLAYPTDKENDFTTSIEKFKERLSFKYTVYN